MKSTRLVNIAAVAAVFTLAGCSSSAATPSSAPTTGPETSVASNPVMSSPTGKTYHILLVTPGGTSNPYFLTVITGVQDTAKQLGAVVNNQSPTSSDLQTQLQYLNAGMATKPDLLIIAPADSQSLIVPLQQIEAAGTAVITIDRDVLDPTARLGTIKSDNVAGGRLAADTMNKLLNGTGDVAYEGLAPGVQSVDDRHYGWTSELAAYKGLKNIGDGFNANDIATISANAGGFITKDPNIAGFFASSANALAATSNAIQNAGKAGKIQLVGFDASPAQLQPLQQGVATALVVQQPYRMGQLAVQDGIAYLQNGTKPPSVTITDFFVMTQANMNTPEAKAFYYETPAATPSPSKS
jgi:ribose transport system substrate-binding protein